MSVSSEGRQTLRASAAVVHTRIPNVRALTRVEVSCARDEVPESPPKIKAMPQESAPQDLRPKPRGWRNAAETAPLEFLRWTKRHFRACMRIGVCEKPAEYERIRYTNVGARPHVTPCESPSNSIQEVEGRNGSRRTDLSHRGPSCRWSDRLFAAGRQVPFHSQRDRCSEVVHQGALPSSRMTSGVSPPWRKATAGSAEPSRLRAFRTSPRAFRAARPHSKTSPVRGLLPLLEEGPEVVLEPRRGGPVVGRLVDVRALRPAFHSRGAKTVELALSQASFSQALIACFKNTCLHVLHSNCFQKNLASGKPGPYASPTCT